MKCNGISGLNSAGSRVASATAMHWRCADDGGDHNSPLSKAPPCVCGTSGTPPRQKVVSGHDACGIHSGSPGRRPSLQSAVCPPVATPVSAARPDADRQPVHDGPPVQCGLACAWWRAAPRRRQPSQSPAGPRLSLAVRTCCPLTLTMQGNTNKHMARAQTTRLTDFQHWQ